MLRQVSIAQSPRFSVADVVYSTTDLHEWDLLAPLCFAVILGECIRSKSRKITQCIWKMVYERKGTPDLKATLREQLLEIDPQLNTAKCDVTFLGGQGPQHPRIALTHLNKSSQIW